MLTGASVTECVIHEAFVHVQAEIISTSVSYGMPNTWKLISTNLRFPHTLGRGSYVILEDAEGAIAPIRTRIAGVFAVEQGWVEFVLDAHPDDLDRERTGTDLVLLCVPSYDVNVPLDVYMQSLVTSYSAQLTKCLSQA